MAEQFKTFVPKFDTKWRVFRVVMNPETDWVYMANNKRMAEAVCDMLQAVIDGAATIGKVTYKQRVRAEKKRK